MVTLAGQILVPVRTNSGAEGGQMVERQAWRPKEFQAAFRIGKTKFWEEVWSGRLETYNVGRSVYVSRAAAEEWQRSNNLKSKR